MKVIRERINLEHKQRRIGRKMRYCRKKNSTRIEEGQEKRETERRRRQLLL
jgi:hypothetical protein